MLSSITNACLTLFCSIHGASFDSNLYCWVWTGHCPPFLFTLLTLNFKQCLIHLPYCSSAKGREMKLCPAAKHDPANSIQSSGFIEFRDEASGMFSGSVGGCLHLITPWRGGGTSCSRGLTWYLIMKLHKQLFLFHHWCSVTKGMGRICSIHEMHCAVSVKNSRKCQKNLSACGIGAKTPKALSCLFPWVSVVKMSSFKWKQ